jgi:hypothetical protein
MAVKTCISWCELKRISKRPGAKHSGNRATLRSPPRIPVTSTPTYNCVPAADPAPTRMRSVSIRRHTSAYVRKRQHTSAYLRPSGCGARECPAALLIRQHTYSRRQHTSAHVSTRQHTSTCAQADAQRQKPQPHLPNRSKCTDYCTAVCVPLY